MNQQHLSFADDDGFKGAVVLMADTAESAYKRATVMKLNPGGEVLGVELGFDKLPPKEFRNKLLSLADLKSFWPDVTTLKDTLN